MFRAAALCLTLFVALIAWAPSARGQTGLIGKPLKVCVTRSQPRDTLSSMLGADARFDCDTRQTSLGAGDYWARAATLPEGAGLTPLALRTGSVWQGEATFWVAYADGKLIRRSIGPRDIPMLIHFGAIIEMPIPVRGVRATTAIWRIDDSANVRGIVVAAHTATPAESSRSDLTLGALYSAFGGLCVALLVYNIALWSALRHRFQLAYCAMAACLLLYAVSSSGVLAWLVPTLPNPNRIRMNYVALALAAASALAFARCFFEDRVFGPRLDLLVRACAVMLVGSALGILLIAPWQMAILDRAYSLSFAMLGVTAIAILVQASRRGSSYLWLFGIAWSLPIALAALRIAGNMHFIRYNFLLDNSTLPAMAVETLLSSIGIAYRMRLLARERDEAREMEMAARLLADVDPLTGLLNRRAFLREAIGRDGMQVLMLVDIDHFKMVNDTLGHDGGDEVLRLVARAMRRGTADGALVARLGGEEFAVLVPAGSAEPADILEAIRAQRMPFDLVVTASIGTCEGTVETEGDWKAMYRNADRALYAAKDAGRDRARRSDVAIAA